MYAKLCFGQFGSILMKLMIMGESFGCCCAYLQVFGELINKLITLFPIFDDNSHPIFKKDKFYSGIIFVIILPLVFLDNISALQKTSFIGDLSVLSFLITIFILFVYNLFHKFPTLSLELLFPKIEFIKAFKCITALLEAYYFQAVIFALYLSLLNRKNKTMKKITKKSVFICSLVYCLTGLLVLLISQSNSNITTQRTSLIQMIYNDETQIKSSNTEKALIICILISLLTSSFFAFPLTFFALKTNFLNLCLMIKKKIINHKNSSGKKSNIELTNNEEAIKTNNEEEKEKIQKNKKEEVKITKLDFTGKAEIITLSKCGKYSIIFLLYLLVLLAALSAKEILTICNFVGSTCSNVITMLAPTLFLIKLSKTPIFSCKLIWEKLVFVIGIAILITFFVILSLGLFNEESKKL